MENIVLRSFVDYPTNIDEFLKVFSPRLFSPFGQFMLKHILALRDSNALKIESLMQRLPTVTQEKKEFIDFLSSECDPNYLALAPLLLEAWRLERQKQIAKRLSDAAANKVVLDLELLQNEFRDENTSYKTLTEWADFYKQKPKSALYPTKVRFIDDYLGGGLELAQLVLISGDPEAGKTRLCLQILENLSFSAKVAFFCFEFTAEAYVRGQIESNKSNVNWQNFFIINDGYDISEVANNIRNLYKQGVRFFLIDSQMRLTAPQGRNMEEEETHKFSTLAKLCHSLGIVVFLIIQTSKTDRDNPTGSKKGGHEASIILRLERCPPDKNDLMQKNAEYDANARIFYIRKNKQTGKHPKEKIAFNTQSLRFFKLEPTTTIYEIPLEDIKRTTSHANPKIDDMVQI